MTDREFRRRLARAEARLLARFDQLHAALDEAQRLLSALAQ